VNTCSDPYYSICQLTLSDEALKDGSSSSNVFAWILDSDDYPIAMRLRRSPVTDVTRKRPKLACGYEQETDTLELLLGPLNVIQSHLSNLKDKHLTTEPNGDAVWGFRFAKLGFFTW
jgi:hypothetical protein